MTDVSTAGTVAVGTTVPAPRSGKFAEALAARRAAKAAESGVEKSLLEAVEDFIPDIPPDPLTEYQSKVNAAIEEITFQEVFELMVSMGIISRSAKPISSWVGDSNKFFCPDPSHDNSGGTMSAWGSREKGKWTCSKGCGDGAGGGDKLSLAKYLFGEEFHDRCNKLAGALRGVKKPEFLVGGLPPESPVALVTPSTSVASAEVAEVGPAGPGETTDPLLLRFDGNAVLAFSSVKDSFLHKYVAAMALSSSPEEFNLPLAMLVIALVSGRRVQLDDEYPVIPTMGIVLVGTSGDGKTNSIKPAKKLMRTVDPAGPERFGINIDKNVISGQELVHTFRKVEKDLETGAVTEYPIRALLEYPEFSGFFGSTKMTGSSLKTFLHEMLDGDEYLGYGSRSAGGKVIARNAFGCVISTVQTDMLSSLFTREDAASGFMNRFIMISGTEKEQVGINRAVIDSDGYTAALREVKSFCHGTGRSKPILWNPDAEALYNKIYKEYLKPIKDADRRALLKRIDLYFKKFCLIFAINERSEYVLPHHVQMARQMTTYIVPTSQTISENVFVADANDMDEWLVRRIGALELLSREKEPTKEHHGPTVAALGREFKKKKWTIESVNKALKGLEIAGIIKGIDGGGKRGQRTKYYYLIEPD